VIPTFHPAAILHGGGEGSKQFEQLREDFAAIQRTLEELRNPPEAPVVPAEPQPSTDEEQLELF
jgi:hypothetical protein